MKLVAYMGIILLALIGFLAWQRMPRKVVFEIVHLSVWVFALSSFATLWAIDHYAPSMLDALIPFVPPIIPVVGFVAWSMRRRCSASSEQKENSQPLNSAYRPPGAGSG